MTLRVCPRCKSLRLSHNGAYWVCAQCELAITGQALVVQNRTRDFTNSQARKDSPQHAILNLPLCPT
jgi:ribosomal protein L37AE/L43A